MFEGDTIAAISSATGPAARMIVRVSGPGALSLAEKLGVAGAKAMSASRESLRFSEMSCPAWVYRFSSPKSYTGEDLIELHIPGNPLLARMLLDWLTANGARQAEPGEFTARAYFHGKLDLSQAEGIAAAIAAQNEQQLSAARKLMSGELAGRLRPIIDLLAESLALVEAGIDFSEERMEFLSAEEMGKRIDRVTEQLRSLVSGSNQFEKLTHEPTIVLAGRPNAGKSTLTNGLAGKHRSIVSPQPGTTRDALSVEISLRRGMARLIDVAGIDFTVGSTASSAQKEIDRQMQELARRAIEQADVLALVRDAADSREDVHLTRAADLRILTKADLLPDGVQRGEGLFVSAKTGEGMEELRNALDAVAFGSDSSGATLALTGRHLQAIGEAVSSLDRARGELDLPEIVAAELRGALDSLGQILGAVSPDDILAEFSPLSVSGNRLWRGALHT